MLRPEAEDDIPMVGDMFRGIGRKRDEPVEQLSKDALCARLGLPAEPRALIGTVPREEYLRLDGPQPTQPRSWRAGVEGSR